MTNRERVLRTRARAMVIKMAKQDENLRRQAWRENAPVREAVRRIVDDRFSGEVVP